MRAALQGVAKPRSGADAGDRVIAGPFEGDGALRRVFVFRNMEAERIRERVARDTAVAAGRRELTSTPGASPPARCRPAETRRREPGTRCPEPEQRSTPAANSRADPIDTVRPDAAMPVLDSGVLMCWSRAPNLAVLVALAGGVAFGGGPSGRITDIGVTIDRYQVDGTTFEDCFCTDLEGTGILSVSVKSPANAIPPLATYQMVYVPDEEQWAYDEHGSPAQIAGKFPDGAYEFTVTYLDLEQEILGVMLVRDFPPYPVLTGFSAERVHWAPWAAGPSATSIEVVVREDEGTFASCDDLPVGATSCALPQGFVQPDSSYVLDILFLASAATASNSNSGLRRTCLSTDPDGDGIFEDGDCNGVAGDHPCTGGTHAECDDNCVEDPNPDQSDYDGNGIGDVCDCTGAVCEEPLSDPVLDDAGSRLLYDGHRCGPVGIKGSVSDGACNELQFRCESIGGSLEFRLRHVPFEGVERDVGRCPFFPAGALDTQNTGLVYRRSNDASAYDPEAPCISNTFHRSVEPTVDSTCCNICSPTEIDWVTYTFDAVGGDLVLRHWQSPDGPGEGPSGPNDTLVLQQTNVPVSDFPAGVAPCRAPDALLGPAGVRVSRYLEPCDVDLDGDCDGADVEAVTSAFGLCDSGGLFNEPVDANHDGCITQADLDLMFDDCSLVIAGRAPTEIYLVSHDDIVSGTPTGPDIATGLLSELLADGDFGRASCLGAFAANPGIDPSPNPPPGAGRYYLARGQSGCAGYGDSSLVPDPRDDLDSEPVCP